MNVPTPSDNVVLKPTLATWVEEFKAQRWPHYAENTKIQVELELRRFALFVGTKELSGKIILEFMAAQHQRTQEPETLAKTVHWVGSFLKWCEQMGYVARQYSSLLVRPQITRKDPLRFTPEQYEKLKEVSKGTPWHYASIMAYRTGARLSDVCLLKWASVDMENLFVRYIPFKSRKTGRYATCPFQAGGDLHEVFKQLEQAKDPRPFWNEFVCAEMAMQYPASGGGGLPSPGGKSKFKRFCEQIGAPKLSFHRLRNAFLSRAVDSGVPFAQIAQITGLASFEVMMRYSKPDVEILRKAIERVDSEPPGAPASNVLSLPAAC